MGHKGADVSLNKGGTSTRMAPLEILAARYVTVALEDQILRKSNSSGGALEMVKNQTALHKPADWVLTQTLSKEPVMNINE